MFLESKIPRGSELRKCRLCFDSEKALIYIFELSGSLKNVALTLSDVLNHVVTVDDQFPPFVCTDCSDKLYEFKTFKVKCNSLRETYQLLLNSKAESVKSDHSIVKRDEDSYQNETRLVSEAADNLWSPLQNIQCLNSPLKMDNEEHKVPVCNDFPSVIVKAFPIVAERNKNDAKIDGTVQLETIHTSKERDRPLRRKKVIYYKQYQSECDSSDTDSSDSFCPSDHGGSDSGSTDSSFNSSRNLKRRKKLKYRTEGVDPGKSVKDKENVLLHGKVGMEMEKILIGGDSIHDSVVGKSAVSSVKQCLIGNACSTIQSNNMDVEPSASQLGSLSNFAVTAQSNLSCSTLNIGSKESLNPSETVEKVSSFVVANDGCVTDNQLVANFLPLENSNKTVDEMVESHNSKSFTLIDLLKSSKKCFPIFSTDSDSLADVLDTGESSNKRETSFKQGRERGLNASCNLEAVDLDSAGISQSFGLQRSNGKKLGLADRQGNETGKASQLYEGISMLELKNFGISFETERDSPEPNQAGSNLDRRFQILEENTDGERETISSECRNKFRGSCKLAAPRCCLEQVGEPGTLHNDQHGAEMVSEGIEENLREPFDFQAQESSSRLAKNSVPCSSKPITAPPVSDISNLGSNTSHFSCESNSGGIQTGVNCSDMVPGSLASLVRFHQTFENTSNLPVSADTQNSYLPRIDCPDSVLNVSNGDDSFKCINQLLPTNPNNTINGKIADRGVVKFPDANTVNVTHSEIPRNPSNTCIRTRAESITHSYEQSTSFYNQELCAPNKSRKVSLHAEFASKLERKENQDIAETVEREDEYTDAAGSISDEGNSNIHGDNVNHRMETTKSTKECLCEFCGKVFLSRISYEVHKRTVHMEKIFKCSKCPKSFGLKHHLTQHLSMHDESRPFSCKECGKSFKLKTHLKQHALVHSKRQMYQCAHCESGFRIKWQHDNHQISHEGKVVWSCEGCAEKLRTWAEYLSHLQEHKKNRTYKCEICLKVYNVKNDLRTHVQKHVKPFECSVCGKHFGLRKFLTYHMRTHTGEKPCVCKLCAKGFSCPTLLRAHMVTHTDARPYKCSFCDHRGKWKSEIKKHEARHLKRKNQELVASIRY